MGKCLIGKVIGRTVGYKFLKDRTLALWKPSGHLQLLDLGKDFFLFKFSDMNDLPKVVYQGPWFVGGHFYHYSDGRLNLSLLLLH